MYLYTFEGILQYNVYNASRQIYIPARLKLRYTEIINNYNLHPFDVIVLIFHQVISIFHT